MLAIGLSTVLRPRLYRNIERYRMFIKKEFAPGERERERENIYIYIYIEREREREREMLLHHSCVQHQTVQLSEREAGWG